MTQEASKQAWGPGIDYFSIPVTNVSELNYTDYNIGLQ